MARLRGRVVELEALNRRREQAEKRAELQTRLLDAVGQAVIVTDLRGAITYWNRFAEELYGWSRDEAVGRTSHDLLATEFPMPLAEIEAELLRAGRWQGELLHRHRDGHAIHVASHWAVHCDASGNVVSVFEVMTVGVR